MFSKKIARPSFPCCSSSIYTPCPFVIMPNRSPIYNTRVAPRPFRPLSLALLPLASTRPPLLFASVFAVEPPRAIYTKPTKEVLFSGCPTPSPTFSRLTKVYLCFRFVNKNPLFVNKLPKRRPRLRSTCPYLFTIC